MDKMTCPHCGHTFNFYEVTHVVEHKVENEIIECPYCHEIADRKPSNGYFVTQKIEGEN
ncbi:hypothetical protein [Enterococcus sp. HY326]|uniref:hypothetical protein n=1 Tax=Enterococcus sp. HY326 TaxID=2971265 RepID=UPI002240A1F8|nr:hypothetical protein [Enterococcus sp. HY326]